MKEELRGLLDNMGLKLSEEKTKITHITEGFTFLGYWVERSIGAGGKMVPKVYIPDSAIKKFRAKTHEILAPNRTNEAVNVKILALNRFIGGWCQYYRCTTSPSLVFQKLSNELYWQMAHWLGKKYKLSMPKVMQRYKAERSFGTKSRKLVRPDEYKAKKRLMKTWHNPYTEKEDVEREKDWIKRESLFTYNRIWIGHERRQEGMDIREEVLLRDGPICAVCQKTFHPSEVQVDHIKLRIRFKHPADADLLDNQQVLCTECHRAKTKADLKVLSRMR